MDRFPKAQVAAKWLGARAWCQTVLRVGSDRLRANVGADWLSLSLTHTLSLSLSLSVSLSLSLFLSLSLSLYFCPCFIKEQSPPLVVAGLSSFPHVSELWEQHP